MVRIGLMAMGGRNWIAGTQYLHSLLYGNSLLPIDQQAAMRVYLDRDYHRLSDYREMRGFAKGVHVSDFFRDPSMSLYRKLGRIAHAVVEHRSWPERAMLDLPRLLRSHDTQVLFSGTHIDRESGLPQICWIPDFQHVHRPDFFTVKERESRDQHFGRIMEEADRVIVSNRYSYEDAIRLYPEATSKLATLPFTMYLGQDWRSRSAQRVVQKHKLPKKFLLLPGQFWKHKNHATVFRAIQLLHERGIDDAVLVCTGLPHDPRFPNHATELQEFLVTHNLRSAVRLLGLLPRHEEVQLMRAAAALIQPSFFEGWSAVVEEGRSLGKVVFASDIPMHREQLTEGVHLFPPTSVEALADLLALHWPQLRPGPDAESESVANADYHARIREFVREFIGVCHGLVE
jgi:glycosyltransferase involved in cell wall biosynthesis